jgi:putative lipoic acid-binding regulatory protein
MDKHIALLNRLENMQARLSQYEVKPIPPSGLAMFHDRDDFPDHEVKLSRNARELADSIITMIHKWTVGKEKNELLQIPSRAQYADVEHAIRTDQIAGRIKSKAELVYALELKMEPFEGKYYKKIRKNVWEAVDQVFGSQGDDFSDYKVKLSRNAGELADSIITMIHKWTAGKKENQLLELPSYAQYADMEVAIMTNLGAGRIKSKAELVDALELKMEPFLKEDKYYKYIIKAVRDAVKNVFGS